MAALVAAGCGGDDGEAVDAAASTGVVSIQNVDGTDVLADSEGRTLYSADVEGDRILCTDACASIWLPVTATADDAESASAELDIDLGVVERPDGDRQLTFGGLPLYSFAEEGPGQLEGDGFVDDFDGTHFEWAAAITGGGTGSAGSDAPDQDSGPGY